MRAIVPLAALAALALTSQAHAQVRGTVVIGDGPVRGAVVVGAPVRAARPYYPPPRVILVDRWRGPRGNAYGWWRRQGFREVTIYRSGPYYYDRWYDGSDRVVVYERNGRYYRWDDERRDGDRGRDHRDRDRDRHDRDRDRDHDGRFQDRNWNH